MSARARPPTYRQASGLLSFAVIVAAQFLDLALSLLTQALELATSCFRSQVVSPLYCRTVVDAVSSCRVASIKCRAAVVVVVVDASADFYILICLRCFGLTVSFFDVGCSSAWLVPGSADSALGASHALSMVLVGCIESRSECSRSLMQPLGRTQK